MRVSDYYQLDRTQPNLDFVDVDIVGDTRIFVDPRALRLLPSNWGNECVSLVQNFFQAVLSAIKEGNHNRARKLLLVLKEPNETHLGLSKKEARGRALGRDSAHDVWKNLSKRNHTQIAASEGTPLPEWDELIRTVREIKLGKEARLQQ